MGSHAVTPGIRSATTSDDMATQIKIFRRARLVGWSIMFVCIAMVVSAIAVFGGTITGFALAFTGALLGYEAFILLQAAGKQKHG